MACAGRGTARDLRSTEIPLLRGRRRGFPPCCRRCVADSRPALPCGIPAGMAPFLETPVSAEPAASPASCARLTALRPPAIPSHAISHAIRTRYDCMAFPSILTRTHCYVERRRLLLSLAAWSLADSWLGRLQLTMTQRCSSPRRSRLAVAYHLGTACLLPPPSRGKPSPPARRPRRRPFLPPPVPCSKHPVSCPLVETLPVPRLVLTVILRDQAPSPRLTLPWSLLVFAIFRAPRRRSKERPSAGRSAPAPRCTGGSKVTPSRGDAETPPSPLRIFLPGTRAVSHGSAEVSLYPFEHLVSVCAEVTGVGEAQTHTLEVD